MVRITNHDNDDYDGALVVSTYNQKPNWTLRSSRGTTTNVDVHEQDDEQGAPLEYRTWAKWSDHFDDEAKNDDLADTM